MSPSSAAVEDGFEQPVCLGDRDSAGASVEGEQPFGGHSPGDWHLRRNGREEGLLTARIKVHLRPGEHSGT
jgi:hypothetical protein